MLAAVLESVSLCDWTPHTDGAYCSRCPLHELDPIFRQPFREGSGGIDDAGGSGAALHLVGYDEDVAASLLSNGE